MDNTWYALFFNISLELFLSDPSRKLLFTKTEIIPHLLEYAKTSEIRRIRCVSCLMLISIGYFNMSESNSTKIEIDELLLKSLVEMTKVFFLFFDFSVFWYVHDYISLDSR
jgi:hypothetical protein